ncbi:MAG: chorismate synthase [Planctomycetes bacterium]|nr:chorismate synthase [Planctomycetota bacterium]
MPFRFTTSGESHGKCVLAVLEGLPAGMRLDVAAIDGDLRRRQGGYGRGPRMKLEKDTVEVLSGTRRGRTIGSPITLRIENRKYIIETLAPLTRVRPGHVDLAGSMKLGVLDGRYAAERASARETAGRVAGGAVARQFLSALGIECVGFVIGVGKARAPSPPESLSADLLRRRRDASPIYCPERAGEGRLLAEIDAARKRGDTLGGTFEVRALGVPVGVGSHAQWCDRLDGRLAQALMAIQAVKAVELGSGLRVAGLAGSEMQDALRLRRNRAVPNAGGGYGRKTNHAGGIEGGLANGEPIVLRAALKPLSTLMRPLRTIDMLTGEPALAQVDTSDVCAIAPAAIIGESVVALVLAEAVLAKFGGDSMDEVKRNLAATQRATRRRFFR